jgi:exopolysaccharide biosynthesis protein
MSRNYRSFAFLFASFMMLYAISFAMIPDAGGRARPAGSTSPSSPGGSGSWVTKGTMPGIVWKRGIYTGAPYGNQTVNVIDLDLSVVSLRPARTASDSSYESVLSMGSRTGALAGVNGGFFCYTDDDICSPLACKAPPKCPPGVVTPRSLLIIDGGLKSANCSTRTTFGLTPKGVPMIQQIAAGSGWPGIAYAVGAGPNLVTAKVRKITQEGFCWYGEQAARTSIAIAGTGHVLLVTFDQGYPAATGMTIDMLADFLVKELQVVSAMNLDGGGSTTMYYNGAIVNNPSDKSCGGCCRCVYDGLFVYGK